MRKTHFLLKHVKTVVFLLVIFFNSIAYGAVVGFWMCSGKATNTLTNSYDRKKINAKNVRFRAQITFFADGTYEQTASNQPTTAQGIWHQKGRKVAFKQNPANAQDNADIACAALGVSCEVLSFSNRSTARELKQGTVLKGINHLRLVVLVRGQRVKSEGVANFACKR